jgi:hypothetical protein
MLSLHCLPQRSLYEPVQFFPSESIHGGLWPLDERAEHLGHADEAQERAWQRHRARQCLERQNQLRPPVATGQLSKDSDNCPVATGGP